MTRTTVRLPDDLLDQAKAHARRTGRTFTQLIEQAIRFEVSQQTASGRVAERSPVYAARPDDADANSQHGEQPAPTAAQRDRMANQLWEQVQELQTFLSALPDLDPRSPEEILGYNAFGLPE